MRLYKTQNDSPSVVAVSSESSAVYAVFSQSFLLCSAPLVPSLLLSLLRAGCRCCLSRLEVDSPHDSLRTLQLLVGTSP